MLIANKRAFIKGALLLLSFAAVVIALMSPVFKDAEGYPQTGLQYADNGFNALSKGSSYFRPDVRNAVRPFMGQSVSMEIPGLPRSMHPLALLILEDAGCKAEILPSGAVSFSGDLGALLQRATYVSELLYDNDGAAVSEIYDENPPLAVARVWWSLLSPMVSRLQKSGDLAAANAVDEVVRKAIEPGNNFYGVQPMRANAHIILIVLLLVFYVAYAIWYGFGVAGLFAGLGLTGHKAPH